MPKKTQCILKIEFNKLGLIIIISNVIYFLVV